MSKAPEPPRGMIGTYAIVYRHNGEDHFAYLVASKASDLPGQLGSLKRNGMLSGKCVTTLAASDEIRQKIWPITKGETDG